MLVTTESAILIVGVHLGLLLQGVVVGRISQMIFAFALIPANLFLTSPQISIIFGLPMYVINAKLIFYWADWTFKIMILSKFNNDQS